MRNFNSQEGLFKPILRIKITPEGLPIQDSGYKNVQSRAKTILVGSRSSPLSRAQVREVLESLQRFHPEINFDPVWIETRGDLDQTTSLRALEKTDFFTQEIEERQLNGEFEISIHSAKDLPEELRLGLRVVALTQGLDPSDVLVMREGDTMESLASPARIGTSSARREHNLLALRSDLQCVDIRGPIQKRLELLEEKYVDGVVVAEAALIRLKLTHLNRIVIPGECARHQGQLAVVARLDDHASATLFSSLDTRGLL
jgi:hydroxymethylbilane synthase